MNKLTVRFDMTPECVDDSTIEARDAGLKLTVVKQVGPGGGNPYLELSGDSDGVQRLLNLWGYSDDDVTVMRMS